MKKSKLIFSVMMLLLTVLLVSCGGSSPKAVNWYLDLEDTTLVYDQDAVIDNTDATKLDWDKKDSDFNVTITEVYNNKTTKTIKQNPTEIKDQGNGVYEVIYRKEKNSKTIYELSYFVHKLSGVPTTDTEDLLFLVPIIKVENAMHNRGKTFQSEGLVLKAVYQNNLTPVTVEDQMTFTLTENSKPTNEMDILTENGKGYRNKETYGVTISYEGKEVNIDVRIEGGYKPIAWKTATFWQKISRVPVAFLIGLFGSITGNSLAWGIIITTILIRTLAWPIYARTNDMSLKMNLAQPEINKLQAKYAMKKDPQSQQKMQMEMMKIYKKYNIGLSGCLLPFLQMPIFISMYHAVRRVAVEGGQFTHQVTHTKLFGMDLAGNGGIWNYVLAALVGITMVVLQKISQKKPSYTKNTGTQHVDPKAQQSQNMMKYMMYFMVFMMVVTAFSSRTMAFYWIIGNLYSLGQTYFNRYMNERKMAKLKEEEIRGSLGGKIS